MEFSNALDEAEGVQGVMSIEQALAHFDSMAEQIRAEQN